MVASLYTRETYKEVKGNFLVFALGKRFNN